MDQITESGVLDVRTVGRVARRREIWATQLKSFDLIVEITAEYSHEAIENVERVHKKDTLGSDWRQKATDSFPLTFGYRNMQRQLWKCHVTPAEYCKHSYESLNKTSPVHLKDDAMVWFSLAITDRFSRTDLGLAQRITEKVRVFPTRGSVGIRWQVLGRGEFLIGGKLQICCADRAFQVQILAAAVFLDMKGAATSALLGIPLSEILRCSQNHRDTLSVASYIVVRATLRLQRHLSLLLSSIQ